jgi:hypothetical protein
MVSAVASVQGSFARAKAWVKELQTQGAAKMIIALVGNKNDLEDGRRIRADEARAYAEENGVLFMETSAKTAQNVSEIFEAIGTHLFLLSLSLSLSLSHALAHRRHVASTQPTRFPRSQPRSPLVPYAFSSFVVDAVGVDVVADGVGLTQTVMIVAIQDSGFVVKEDPKPIKKGGCCS